MPHSPAGCRQHRPAVQRQAFHQDGVEGLAIDRQRHRLAQFGIVERRIFAVHHQIGLGARGDHLADRVRRARLDVLHQGNADVGGKGDVVIAGRERQHPRGAAVDHPEGDLVEIRPVLLPVIGIAHQADRVAAVEFDQPERPGADRFGAHGRLRHVAGIDRRKRARQQHRQARLRLAEFERRLIIAVDADVLQLRVPDLARVALEVLDLALADDHPPGALHVFCGERRAVMPFDALPQLEGQLGVGRIPRPAFGQIRHHGVDALVDLEGIEHHEVVEHGRKRRHRGDGRFLVQRGRGRIVVVIEPQRAAPFSARRRAQRPEARCKAARGSWPFSCPMIRWCACRLPLLFFFYRAGRVSARNVGHRTAASPIGRGMRAMAPATICMRHAGDAIRPSSSTSRPDVGSSRSHRSRRPRRRPSAPRGRCRRR